MTSPVEIKSDGGVRNGIVKESPVLEPIFCEPKVFSRVWGGSRISEEFGRTLPPDPIGESWEVHGDLTVVGTDLTLNEFISFSDSLLLGTQVEKSAGFPLLIKWLDCSSWLSIQVHPDDQVAKRLTGDPLASGKTEAWYIHRTYGPSELILGFRDPEAAERLSQTSGPDIVEFFNKQRSSRGELHLIPAGMVHALGPGNLIYEVQQSSDLTYRFFDWGRPRELHPQQALECVMGSRPVPCDRQKAKVSCPFFSLEARLGDQSFYVGPESFQIITSTDSKTVLSWNQGRRHLKAGQSALLPAGLGVVEVSSPRLATCLHVEIPTRE